jgi:hypothetical protein
MEGGREGGRGRERETEGGRGGGGERGGVGRGREHASSPLIGEAAEPLMASRGAVVAVRHTYGSIRAVLRYGVYEMSVYSCAHIRI